MDASAITSEVAGAANGNQTQLPSHRCISLARANFDSSQPCFRDHGFEISTLQFTQLLYGPDSRSNCYIRDDKLPVNCSDSTHAATICTELSTFMEIDNPYPTAPQYSASSSGNHSKWPRTSPVHQICQKFKNEMTPSRYPPRLGGARKRVDSSVPCPSEERLTSFDTRPESNISRFPDSSVMWNENISQTTPLNITETDNSLFAEKWLVFEPTKDVLPEATRIPVSAQVLRIEQEILLKAKNSRPHQDLRADYEKLGIRRKAKQAVITTQERGPDSCNKGLTQAQGGSLTDKENRTSRDPKGKSHPEISDEFSELCIYRAARGCAVHPRSIAERVRRSHIAHRVKTLEDKLPDSIKRAGKRRLYTDEMLERTILYIKWLQRSIQMLLSHEITSGGDPGSSSTLRRNNEVDESL